MYGSYNETVGGIFFAGNWDGKPRAGFMSSTSEMPPAIHGCPVFVVDCTSNLQFGKPSKECDAVINQIVDFLLSTLR